MIPNQQVPLPDPDPFLAMPAPHVNGAPANPNPPAAHNQGADRQRRLEAVSARLRARFARQQEAEDLAMAIALQAEEEEEEEEEEEAEEVLPRQLPRYVYLRFVNNVKQPVDAFRVQDSTPDTHVCSIDASGNIVGGGNLRGKQGTRIFFKWDSGGQPQEQMTLVDSSDSSDSVQEIHIGETEETQWKHGALKLDFLMKELTRMGASNEDLYPNFTPIVDMHQDIHLPSVTEREKEVAGIPSGLTNFV